MQIFREIQSIVKTIPRGKVTTYGTIAKLVNTTPRVVGWALRGNKNPSIPCHRVVKKDGFLAAQFSLGNWPEQRRRLEAEGLKFKGQQILYFTDHFSLIMQNHPTGKQKTT
jgi:methylated-DNA-protein-cysteine methyltransferase related protein